MASRRRPSRSALRAFPLPRDEGGQDSRHLLLFMTSLLQVTEKESMLVAQKISEESQITASARGDSHAALQILQDRDT